MLAEAERLEDRVRPVVETGIPTSREGHAIAGGSDGATGRRALDTEKETTRTREAETTETKHASKGVQGGRRL